MILADKIINEREKCGWSQEELAEKLDVSRQAVSKWEGAQATPDIQKIIKMAELFGVSTDYLLKDELEPENYVHEAPVSYDTDSRLRTVTFEEANEFISLEENNAGKVANGVSMCIASPVLLILLGGLTESKAHPISEGLAAVVGLMALFALVAAAVFMFISYGMRRKPFEYLEKEAFETAYGVDGLVREKKKAHESKYINNIAFGVILCVLSAVPLIVAASMEAPDAFIAAMAALLLLIVSAGVNLLIRAGIIHSCYEMLLQENEYTKSEKSKSRHLDAVSGIYWCAVTAVYLGWSFVTDAWDKTWIIWPVAGVAFAVVAGITKALTKEK